MSVGPPQTTMAIAAPSEPSEAEAVNALGFVSVTIMPAPGLIVVWGGATVQSLGAGAGAPSDFVLGLRHRALGSSPRALLSEKSKKQNLNRPTRS